MLGLLVTGHGHFATGLNSSLELIAGAQPNVALVDFEADHSIEVLKEKLERLENERASIKAREHKTWELTNIGANIRETKLRIARLEEQENLVFPDTEFKGGRYQERLDMLKEIENRNMK